MKGAKAAVELLERHNVEVMFAFQAAFCFHSTTSSCNRT